MKTSKIICMIPARIGSQRFKKKNLALIDNKPVLAWGIEAAKDANIFDKIVVNGDHQCFKEISNNSNVDFFLREQSLGLNQTKSDEVIINFINKFECDFIVWFNAIAPLQKIKDIRNFSNQLLTNKFQSLFSVRTQHIQTLYQEKPLNFSYKKQFERTQDLKPPTMFVPSMMGWNTESFKNFYSKNEYGFFCGQTGYFEVSLLSSLVIKTEEDFRMIRSIIEGFKTYENPITYYSN